MSAAAKPKSRKPAAPRWERKADERPGALLEAALDIFARHGFHATRLETVAEAAGVSKGTVYTYFKNKEDLLRKALEHRLNVSMALNEAQIEKFRGSAVEKLRFFLERLWEKVQTEDWGRVHKLLHGEIAEEAPELFRFWIRNGLLQGWKKIAGVISEGQASGEFRRDADAEGIARVLVSGLLNQAFLQAHMGVAKLDGFPMDRIFSAGIDMALRGLRAAPATPSSRRRTR